MLPKTSRRKLAPAPPARDPAVSTIIKIRSPIIKKPGKGQGVRSNVLSPEIQSQLAPFMQTVAKAPQAALLLDYDGTLAPFRAKRDQAYPYPGVASLLQHILR